MYLHKMLYFSRNVDIRKDILRYFKTTKYSSIPFKLITGENFVILTFDPGIF